MSAVPLMESHTVDAGLTNQNHSFFIVFLILLLVTEPQDDDVNQSVSHQSFVTDRHCSGKQLLPWTLLWILTVLKASDLMTTMPFCLVLLSGQDHFNFL